MTDIKNPKNKDKAYYLNEIKELASSNGFELFTNEWLGTDVKHKFKHLASGVIYEYTPHYLKSIGFPLNPRTIEESEIILKKQQLYNRLKAHAALYGFKILNTEWGGQRTKHKFIHLKSGISYEGYPDNLMRQGFPKDLRTPSDMYTELRVFSEKNGFELLETEWLGVMKKHKFKHLGSEKTYNGIPNDVYRNGFPKDLRTNDDMLEEFRQYATKNGFIVIDAEWRGNNTKYKLTNIKTGDIYTCIPNLVKSRGFPSELYSDANQLENIKSKAKTKGFNLLSTTWNGINEPYQFEELSSGNIVEGLPHEILKTSLIIARTNPLEKLENLSKLADANGFELLDKLWQGVVYKYQFRHKTSGLIKEFSASAVQQHGFPKDLRTNTDKLENLKDHASDHGFELLDTEWHGAKEKYQFKHKNTEKIYEWTASSVNNYGFPKNLRTNQDRLDELANYATSQGYKLLDKEWLGYESKHNFKHIKSRETCQVSPAVLKGNNGFPLLGGQRYITEEICRQIMKHIFGGEFKTNNDRLKIVHGKNMQLDGYQTFTSVPDVLLSGGKILSINDTPHTSPNDINEIAFEFQGHWGHYDNEKIMARDKLRLQYCNDHGIILIVIDQPDWDRNRDSQYMFNHVCEAITKTIRTERPLKFNFNFELDLSNWAPDQDALKELRTFSKNHGFELLEPKWLGKEKHHKFVHLKSGNTYSSTPINVLSRGFPKDLRSDLEKLKDLNILAKNAGFELLDSDWHGSIYKYRFRHIESNKPYDSKLSTLMTNGFPKDIRSALDRLNELAEMAKLNGFELLDVSWKGSAIKHQFRHLTSGIILERSPSNIKNYGFSIKRHLSNTPVVSNDINSLAEKIGNLFFDDVPPVETFMPDTDVEFLNAIDIVEHT